MTQLTSGRGRSRPHEALLISSSLWESSERPGRLGRIECHFFWSVFAYRACWSQGRLVAVDGIIEGYSQGGRERGLSCCRPVTVRMNKQAGAVILLPCSSQKQGEVGGFRESSSSSACKPWYHDPWAQVHVLAENALEQCFSPCGEAAPLQFWLTAPGGPNTGEGEQRGDGTPRSSAGTSNLKGRGGGAAPRTWKEGVAGPAVCEQGGLHTEHTARSRRS